MNARMTAERLAALSAELTDRDRAIVAMLARVKLANGTQLRRATMADNSAAAERASRRQLARLLRLGVVERLDRRQGGLGRGSDAWTYALGIAGRRLAGDAEHARRPHLPRPLMWAHVLLGAEVFTRLTEAVRLSGRSLETWQGEPGCWRSFGGPLGENVLLKPDSFAVVAGQGFEDASFVEVDTGSQSRNVIRAKLAAYRLYAGTGREQAQRDGVFPLTVFVTTGAERKSLLEALVAELTADVQRLFTIGTVEDAARLLMGGEA